MQPSRDVSRLVEIMQALRDPLSGCPWDIEQTMDTIIPYTIEETYEVVDAIERRDPENLREELGDLLLQVVYYAQIAAEQELFDFSDVVETVTTKMVRRHPHVFGDAEARNAKSAKGQWDRIKAEEKTERLARRAERAAKTARDGLPGEWDRPVSTADTTPALLDGIPGAMPSLMLALKMQSKAATVGFDWAELPPILDKLREEIVEFEDAVASDDRSAQADELGDLMFCLVNLGRRLEINPDQALRGTVAKFRRRFDSVERCLVESGRSLQSATLEEMEHLWHVAKCAEPRRTAKGQAA